MDGELEKLRALVRVMDPIYTAAVLLVLDQDEGARFAPSGVWVQQRRWDALKRAVMENVEGVRAVHAAMGRVDAVVKVVGAAVVPAIGKVG